MLVSEELTRQKYFLKGVQKWLQRDHDVFTNTGSATEPHIIHKTYSRGF